MASVTPQSASSDLFERAAEAVKRSRELCADTRRLIKEASDEIAKVRGTDRQLETALRERKRVSLRVSGQSSP